MPVKQEAVQPPPVTAETPIVNIAPAEKAVADIQSAPEPQSNAEAIQPDLPAEHVSAADNTALMDVVPRQAEEDENSTLAAATTAVETPPVIETLSVEALAAETVIPFEPAAETAPVEKDNAAAYTADMTVDDICAAMTFEDALAVVVDTGVCIGWTLQKVFQTRPASLKWYLYSYKGENNLLRAGAKILLESMTEEKAG